jgi:hypothetical protein
MSPNLFTSESISLFVLPRVDCVSELVSDIPPLADTPENPSRQIMSVIASFLKLQSVQGALYFPQTLCTDMGINLGRFANSPILLIRMPFAAFNGFDLRDKLKIIREGNYYSVRDIFTDCYYPIMIPLLERWVRMV